MVEKTVGRPRGMLLVLVTEKEGLSRLAILQWLSWGGEKSYWEKSQERFGKIDRPIGISSYFGFT